MRLTLVWSLWASSILAAAQGGTESITITDTGIPASATYASVTSTITLSTISGDTSSGSQSGASTTASSSNSSSTVGGTLLVGTAAQTAANDTATGAPAPSAPPTINTRPCNGHVDYCQKSYGNITWVGAHNSPFHMPNNAGSNQKYGVISQLNDGIRLLQGQTHKLNGVMHYCHTTCDLLDGGTAQDYFSLVAAWLAAPQNRFEVVTILIGNADFLDVGNFTSPIEQSGLKRFVYTPPKIPMAVGNWPTLSELIALNTRALIFMDYQADQKLVPYIMDEFSHIWETPFSPQNSSFPCTVERPPKLPKEGVQSRMYMLNNNLNVPVDLFGAQVLIPNIAALNTTNAALGQGSLGVATNGCVDDWQRSPNFLLVDYYEAGNFPGSVFQVAARANGVTYKKGNCCGNSDAINAGVRALQANLQMWGFVPFVVAAIILF